MTDPDVLIVGAGLSGLTCAVQLEEKGLSTLVLEAEGEVGGRVRTQAIDGFLLDRGFQTFLTSYPEAQQLLDYDALDLQYFDHGALIYDGDRSYAVHDPLIHPQYLLRTLRAPAGNLTDKLRLLRMRLELALKSPSVSAETTTAIALRHRWGFSETMIERLLRPFFGGVLLDHSLESSSKVFEFIFRMFAGGRAALPSGGMQRIPEQLADRLPEGTIVLNTPVVDIRPRGVKIKGEGWIEAKRTVVLATDEVSASRLLESDESPSGRPSRTVYFAAPRPPFEEPLLVLNGSGSGIVNTVAVLTNVARGYAPLGLALVSVSVVQPVTGDTRALETVVRNELTAWFGNEVRNWEHLHTDSLAYALPQQLPPHRSPATLIPKRGVLQCGDYLSTGSINGAIASGRQTAEFITG